MMYGINGTFITASIFDGIEDAGIDILKAGIELFQTAQEFAYLLLGADPTSGTFSDAWIVVVNLFNVFSVIGSSLLILFFLYGYCRDTIDIRSEMRLESTVKMFIRLIITLNVMNCFIIYLPKFTGWAIKLVNVTEYNKATIDAQTIADDFAAAFDHQVLIFFIGLILWLLLAFCSVMLLWSVCGRFMNLYVLVPFASIALSTLAGGGQLSQTGYSYIKSVLAYTFEIVAVGIVLAISDAFLNATIVTEETSAGGFMVVVEFIVKVITITAAVKGCSGTVRRAFNL